MAPTRWLLRALVVIGLIALLAVSAARTVWELDYRQTTVAVHLGDLVQQGSNSEPLAETLAELREAGATAVTVSPLSIASLHDRFFPQRIPSVSISPDTLNAVRDNDLALYWRLEDWVPAEDYGNYLNALMAHEPTGLIAARAVGAPANEMDTHLQAILESERAMLGWAEFIPPPFGLNGSEARERNIFRAHLLERAERARLTEPDALNRYVQAVRERRVRLVEVRAGRLDQVRQDTARLRDRLVRSGYALAPSPERVPAFRGTLPGLGPTARDGLAWLLAVLGPLGAYGLIRRRLSHNSSLWTDAQILLIASGISAVGGLAAAATLSDPAHFLGLHDIPGVKPALAVPVAGVALLALTRSSWRTWRPLDGIVWVGAGMALIVALMRSGSFSVLPVPELEREMRNALEGLLIVRPRFKEFLIGHPALLVWMGLGAVRLRPWAGGLLAIGMLGQVSIVNSFLHLHTPLWVTLLRTFHGLWLGLVIGLALLYPARTLARRLTTR